MPVPTDGDRALGAMLRAARQRKQLSQREVGPKSVSRYSAIERGIARASAEDIEAYVTSTGDSTLRSSYAHHILGKSDTRSSPAIEGWVEPFAVESTLHINDEVDLIQRWQVELPYIHYFRVHPCEFLPGLMRSVPAHSENRTFGADYEREFWDPGNRLRSVFHLPGLLGPPQSPYTFYYQRHFTSFPHYFVFRDNKYLRQHQIIITLGSPNFDIYDVNCSQDEFASVVEAIAQGTWKERPITRSLANGHRMKFGAVPAGQVRGLAWRMLPVTSPRYSR